MALLVLAGCRPEILPERDRTSDIDAVQTTVIVTVDGILKVAQTYEFASDRGGTVGLPAALGDSIFGGVRDVAIDGVPAIPIGGTFNAQVEIPKRTATVTFDLLGAVDRYSDIAVVDVDVLAAPDDTSRQDPDVDLEGSLTVPEGADGIIDPHLHGIRDEDVTVSGSTVTFSGQAPIWLPNHDLEVAFPADRVPFVEATPFPFLTTFQTAQQVAEASDSSLGSTLDSLDQGTEIARWVITALAFGIPGIAWFMVVVGVIRRMRERKKMVGFVPDHVVDPPTAVDPAIVAVLDGEGRPDRAAVAGTVLAMAQRKAIDIQQYGDKLVVRVPLETTATNESERIVLDALRRRGSDDGRVEGPPIFDGAPWWRSFKRDAVGRARTQGLVMRWLPIGQISGAIVMTAVGVAIFFFTQPGIFVAVVLGAQVVSAFASFLGGWTLTTSGWRQRALWRAFGRYIHDQGKLDRDVGPESVKVWGPYVTYGSVLDEAPGAARPLTP